MYDNATLCIEMHYLPCINYVQLLAQHGNVVFEAYEHFIKQTYRNRCTIYGANGVQDLIIPVLKKSAKIPVKDLQVAYTENWQHTHFMAIHSAYKSSPYYDFFEDDMRALFAKKEKYLLDYNILFMEWIAKTLKLNLQTRHSDSYVHQYDNNTIDARNTISPKNENVVEHPKYLQVFEEKHGYKPNLSVIDWIFNDLQGARSYCNSL